MVLQRGLLRLNVVLNLYLVRLLCEVLLVTVHVCECELPCFKHVVGLAAIRLAFVALLMLQVIHIFQCCFLHRVQSLYHKGRNRIEIYHALEKVRRQNLSWKVIKILNLLPRTNILEHSVQTRVTRVGENNSVALLAKIGAHHHSFALR